LSVPVEPLSWRDKVRLISEYSNILRDIERSVYELEESVRVIVGAGFVSDNIVKPLLQEARKLQQMLQDLLLVVPSPIIRIRARELLDKTNNIISTINTAVKKR